MTRSPDKPWLPTLAQERRAILAISGPLIAAYIAEMGMVITDMLIVGRLGSIELAAVGLGGDWFYVLLLIGIGVFSIMGVLMAQARGSGKPELAIAYLYPGMVGATLLSIPISLMSWYLAPLLALADQDPAVLTKINQYMKPLTFTVWPALIYVVLRNYLTALQNTRSLMYLTLFGLILNLCINIVLVHGKLGFPAMGVAGAGLGTTIVHFVMLFVLLIFVLRKKLCNFTDMVTPQCALLPALREIFFLGFPIAASHLLGGCMFIVAAIMMGVLGADYLAAQQLVYTLIYTSISISIGFGDAAKVRVAYAMGKNSPAAVAQSATQCLMFGGVVCLLMSLILWIFPRSLVGLFLHVDNPQNVLTVTIALSIAAYAGVFQVFDGINVIASNALRGLRDTKTSMWTTLVCYWFIALSSAWYLGFWLELDALGIWLGMLAGVITSSLFLVWRFYRSVDVMANSMSPRVAESVTTRLTTE